MAFYVYVLRSQTTSRFYVGHTESLIKRIFEHNNNRTPSIKNRGPWELFYSETYETRSAAAVSFQGMSPVFIAVFEVLAGIRGYW